mmetsp:Transcript_12636/g.38676  ORF Transcript_12636/g.38676 Transcript_12636/m.38676 type:complete len:103 (-) Transcript_12636:1261-1569(-)
MSHTILLVQGTREKASRTWYEYESVKEMVEGLCAVYERSLRRSSHNVVVSYDTSQLFAFVDETPDLACLVLQKDTSLYEPHDKEWIKQTCLNQLRRTAKSNR